MVFLGTGDGAKEGTLLVVGEEGTNREEEDVGWWRQSKVRSLCRWEL